MGKRAAIATDAGSPKKAKAPAVDPVFKKKFKEVSAALQMIDDLPAGVATMLEDILPLSLGEFKEDRHKFQNEAVEYMDKEIQKLEVQLQSDLDDAGQLSESIAAQKVVKDEEIAELQTALAKAENFNRERKLDLAQVAATFQQSKTALQDAELDQEMSSKELVSVEKKRAALEDALTGSLLPLKDEDGERSEEIARALIGRLQKLMDLDTSLATSMPLVLSKPASERGTFDNIAAQQLEQDVRKTLSDLAAQIADGEPAKQRRAAAIDAAKQAFEAAKARQMASANEFIATKQAMEQASETLQTAYKEIKNLQRDIGKAKKSHTTAEFRLSSFREGPLATFAELRDRTPPPAPAVDVEPTESAIPSCGAEATAAAVAEPAPPVQEAV